MISTTLALWIFVAAVAVVVLAATVLRLTRRRHIEIERPSLEDPVVGPTLVRVRSEPVAIEEPPAAEIPLAENPLAENNQPSDDLLRIKGVGPRLAVRLNELGITRYDQIAGWTDADIEAIDARLGPFSGRIERDRWLEQARYLATGDVAGFEAQFGKINDAPGAPGTTT